MDHGLLAVHILARVQRLNRDALVPMVGRCDDDGVDILARQHFAIIARGEQVAAPQFFGARQTAVVDVAHCDQLHAGKRYGIARVAHAHAAGAD